MKTNTLYVAGLEKSIDEKTLQTEFAKHGLVERVTIIKDKVTREPKGFAYVLFHSDQDATSAMKEMDGRVLADKPIKVKYSYSGTPEWVSIIENRTTNGSDRGSHSSPRGAPRGAYRDTPRGGMPRGNLSRGGSSRGGSSRGGLSRGSSGGPYRGSPRGGPLGRGGLLGRGDRDGTIGRGERGHPSRRGAPNEHGGINGIPDRDSPLRRGGARGRGSIYSEGDRRLPYARMPLDEYDDGSSLMKRSRVDPEDSWDRERELPAPYVSAANDPYVPRSKEVVYESVSRRDPYDEQPIYRPTVDGYDLPERRPEDRRMVEERRPLTQSEGRRLPPSEGRRLPPGEGRQLFPPEGRRMPPSDGRRNPPVEGRFLGREPVPLMARRDIGSDQVYVPGTSRDYPPESYPSTARDQVDTYGSADYRGPRNDKQYVDSPYPKSGTLSRYPESGVHSRPPPVESGCYPSSEGAGRYPERLSDSRYARDPPRSYVGYGEGDLDPYAELSKPAAASRNYPDYMQGTYV